MGTLKEILNEALLYNKEHLNDKERYYCDVLIMGPTGCGKTAIVREWLEEHEGEINQWNWFANCYPKVVRLMYDENRKKMPCSPWVFDSKTIEEIDKPSTVFVIDHFDLTEDDTREQMLSLVRDREVSLFTGEKKKLNNGPLMIIAIAFDRAEFGYSDLTDEDICSFKSVVKIG